MALAKKGPILHRKGLYDMALTGEAATAFGRRVKHLREERQWSQSRLGIEAGKAVGHADGFSPSTIKHYEAGERREMDAHIVWGVARALGVTVEYLLSGQQSPLADTRGELEGRVSALERAEVLRQVALATIQQAQPQTGPSWLSNAPPTFP